MRLSHRRLAAGQPRDRARDGPSEPVGQTHCRALIGLLIKTTTNAECSGTLTRCSTCTSVQNAATTFNESMMYEPGSETVPPATSSGTDSRPGADRPLNQDHNQCRLPCRALIGAFKQRWQYRSTRVARSSKHCRRPRQN